MTLMSSEEYSGRTDLSMLFDEILTVEIEAINMTCEVLYEPYKNVH